MSNLPSLPPSQYANPNAVAQNASPGGGPISDPAAWDYITLAGKRSPGVIPRGGVDFARVFKWDKKEGKGSIGATPTLTNRPPAEGTITFHFWRDTHFREWNVFIVMFDYDPTKKDITGLDVDHPELRRLKIKSLIVEEIGVVKDIGNGLYEVKLKVFEYTPPPKLSGNGVATPKGSTGDSKTGEGDPANPFDDPVYAADVAKRLRKIDQIECLKKATKP